MWGWLTGDKVFSFSNLSFWRGRQKHKTGEEFPSVLVHFNTYTLTGRHTVISKWVKHRVKLEKINNFTKWIKSSLLPSPLRSLLCVMKGCYKGTENVKHAATFEDFILDTVASVWKCFSLAKENFSSSQCEDECIARSLWYQVSLTVLCFILWTYFEYFRHIFLDAQCCGLISTLAHIVSININIGVTQKTTLTLV